MAPGSNMSAAQTVEEKWTLLHFLQATVVA